MNNDTPAAWATAGKRWRLRRLADAEGCFSMVAVDQRPPIFAALAQALGCAPEAVPHEQVALAKRVLAEGFAGQASALLVDPNWGYPAVADVLDPARGLLLTLEDHRTTDDRRSRTIADWSVGKIRALGGDAVKLLAWYHPRAELAVREHQQALVQEVGEACARCDVPFVLELLLYPLRAGGGGAAGPVVLAHGAPLARAAASADAYVDDPAKRADEVLESVQTFAAARYRVDLFKLESPLPPAQVPALGSGAAAEACARAYAGLHRACGGRPWVMLSAGAAADDFERVVAHAAAAGAAGFLAGRALWSDALARWPDRAAVAQALATTGRTRLARLRRIVAERGRPWQPGAWPLQLGDPQAFPSSRGD